MHGAVAFQASAAEDAQAWVAAINHVLEARERGGSEAEITQFIQTLKDDPERSGLSLSPSLPLSLSPLLPLQPSSPSVASS